MREIIIQSSIYEDGKEDLRNALNLASISVAFDFRLCFDVSDNYICGSKYVGIEKGRVGELLNKAISLYDEERLETFYLFCSDTELDIRFCFSDDFSSTL